jgi:hypothetical protein
MSQQQREVVSAFDRAKASFNSPQSSGYFDLYDSDLILHGFPPKLPANFEGLKMFTMQCGRHSLTATSNLTTWSFRETESQRGSLFLGRKEER